jgi:pimeloyl-ACP methyl ester carboxylesterase
MIFVMVPGGWQGGWAFDAVATALRSEGHDVVTVTLAGLEPSAARGGSDPANLDDHIRQVADVVQQHGGRQIALCGHSYGGMVIAGVADRLGDRLDHVVFIDAYVPDDGDSCWSLTSDAFREMFIAGSTGDGRWVAVPEGMDTRARPHPLPSFLQAVRLTATADESFARTFISGGSWPGSPFVELCARLRADAMWTVHEIPVGHNIARSDPAALAGILAAMTRG